GPHRRRCLDAAYPGVARIGRSVVPPSGPGRDPAGLAGGQSTRLAVLTVDPAGHAAGKLRSGRGLGWREPADRPGLRGSRSELTPGSLGGIDASPDEPGLVDRLPGSGRLRRSAVPPRLGSDPLCFAPLAANPPDSGQCPGGDRLGATLLVGSPRGYARCGVHLVRLCIPLAAGRVLRLR